MRFLIRALLFLVVIGGLCLGVAYFAAPRFIAAPAIEIKSPEKYLGQSTPLEFFVNGPSNELSKVEATLEQLRLDLTEAHAHATESSEAAHEREL